MTERTRRASEAVEAHLALLEERRPGSAADYIEGPLLDPARDRNDPRFGHEEYLYADGDGTFQGWLREMTNRAMTFAVTTDLMREVVLTQEMIAEEGLDYLPLLPHHVPAKDGLILFPYGVENPYVNDEGIRTRRIMERGRGMVTYLEDSGGGDRHMIDGFLWSVNDRVSKDGHAGAPVEGVTILPITRWRGRADDRPFRVSAMVDGRQMPELVLSDLTAWAFDEPGQTEWGTPYLDWHMSAAVNHWSESELETQQERGLRHLAEYRLWLRSLVWATFRWLTEEVWIAERADRQASRRFHRARPRFAENAPEDGDVTIVDLRPERREEAREATDGEPPWWRTRWTVRGHWAKRRYAIRNDAGEVAGPVRGPGSKEGTTFYYDHVWIEPYVKGPDTAPLVMRDRVGVLCR